MQNVLRNAKSNSVGIDDILVKYLKASTASVIPALLDIFNSSLTSSTFPAVWKSSLIRPICKVKTPTSPGDYRPISILCAASKCLEKIVYSQVVDHLTAHQLLDPFQSGFRKNYSTQTASIKVTEDIRFAIDKKMVIILVLFDFSKAFDSVNHQSTSSICQRFQRKLILLGSNI